MPVSPLVTAGLLVDIPVFVLGVGEDAVDDILATFAVEHGDEAAFVKRLGTDHDLAYIYIRHPPENPRQTGLSSQSANLSSKRNGYGLEAEEYLVRGQVAKTLAWSLV